MTTSLAMGSQPGERGPSRVSGPGRHLPGVAILSLYSGQVPRGVEAWAGHLASSLGAFGVPVTLIQGGPPPASPVAGYRVRSVDCPAVDRSGEGGVLHRWLHGLSLTRADRDVSRFYHRAARLLWEQPADVVLPCHYHVKILRGLFRRLDLQARIVGVTHGGVPRDWHRYDGFVALSARDRERMNSGAIPVVSIPNGVDLSRFDPRRDLAPSPTLERMGIRQDALSRPVILAVSALVGYKRIDRLVRAFSWMKGGTLLVIGEGPERSRLEKLGQELRSRAPGAKVLFIPALPREEMPAAYALADVFSHPAEECEVFGIAILEAMASGLPVLVNDDPVRRAIVERADYLIDPEDPASYAARLEELATARQEHAAFCRNRAARFDWSRVAREYLEFFQALTSPSAREGRPR